MSKKDLKFNGNHATKHNPNNHQYWRDKGYPNRPDNWKELLAEEEKRETSSKTRQHRRDDDEFWYDNGCGPLSSDEY
jgi:hypothetical protein